MVRFFPFFLILLFGCKNPTQSTSGESSLVDQGGNSFRMIGGVLYDSNFKICEDSAACNANYLCFYETKWTFDAKGNGLDKIIKPVFTDLSNMNSESKLSSPISRFVINLGAFKNRYSGKMGYGAGNEAAQAKGGEIGRSIGNFLGLPIGYKIGQFAASLMYMNSKDGRLRRNADDLNRVVSPEMSDLKDKTETSYPDLIVLIRNRSAELKDDSVRKSCNDPDLKPKDRDIVQELYQYSRAKVR